MPTNKNQNDLYVDNLLRHLATQHPIFWSRKDLSLIGVPDILPTVPIPPTDISGYSYTDDAFGYICALDEAAAEQKGSHPYIELRSLVGAIAEWFGVSRSTIVTTNTLHPTLKLGRYYYQLKPVKVLCCLSVPCTVYLDAPLREKIKGNYRKETVQDLLRLSALGQSDDSLEPFDFAMLIALAEDHRFCQVQPDVGGFYTTRILYPDSTLQQFIIVTAKVAVETLEALENDEEVVRKVKISRYAVPLGDTRKEKDSVLLKIMATIPDEGMRAGATAPIFSDNDEEEEEEEQEM
ncbi:hypothetical protein K443DRAFT_675638 [Laccaria amethystina LaAM-08-1]|uniref:Uncharacterized protein n=1 Tax=Laccaria amethystina LaAM-08-1 TaxID=1095629 RepID=A0A0C9WYH7_9AGAR|nr:hypothetical protein K443DRAFT_675638 [Laccaria amethystina LaAM-08-1]